MASEFVSIIINAPTGISALKKLLTLRKMTDRKLTLSFLAKKLNLKSASYLSDALNEKKPLKPDYLDELLEFTNISVTEARLLKARILYESSSTPESRRKRLGKEIKLLKQQLLVHQLSVPSVAKFHFSALVLVSFYLFDDHRASRDELVRLFGKENYHKVERSLHELLSIGAVKKEGNDYILGQERESSGLIFAQGEHHSEKEFLKNSFLDGIEQVDRYYDQADISCFYSSVSTVNREEYKKILEEFKSKMRTFLTDLNTQKPDTIISLNIQMYPVLSK